MPSRKSSNEICPVRPKKSAEHAVFVQVRASSADDDDHGAEAEAQRTGARRAGAGQSQARKSEMAEDQRIIAKRVEADRDKHDDQRRVRLRQRRRIVAQHLEPEREGQAKAQRYDKARRRVRQFGRLAERHQDVPREEHQHDQRHRHDEHGPQAHARDGPHARAIVRRVAQDVRNHRRHRRTGTHPDQPAEEEHGVAERRAGQRGLADMAQHQHVGRHDRHLRQLRDDQRAGQLHQLAGFSDPRVQAVPLNEHSGIGNIEFSNIGHGTDLLFSPGPGTERSATTKNPPEPGSGGFKTSA